MENRTGSSHETEIPKKSRSLELKSLYLSKGSKETQIKNLKRKGGADVTGVEKSHERKKSRKAVAISSLGKVNGNGSKCLEEVYNGSLSSASHDLKDSKLGLNNGSGFSTISQALEGSFTKIPRRKRGFVGRKKVQKVGQVSKTAGQSSSNLDNVNQVTELTARDTGKQVQSLKAEHTGSYGPEENRKSETDSGRVVEEKDGNAGHLVVKNSDSSLEKPNTGLSFGNIGSSSLKKSLRKRSRRKKDLVAVGKSVVEHVVPSIDTTVRKSDNVRDDDEENLEENAARMLSSRFDPNCTGFSSNNKSSAFPSSNDLSFLLSSDHEFVAHGSNYVSGSESVGVAGRVLRPRNRSREKGNSRKRRHYYEVFYGNLDAYWVLNRRVKVFWPLDKSWYYGLVSGYDKLKKLHHVRYDDRDEEWINLQNERFKLLLLPNEVPGKPQRKRFAMRVKLSNGEKGKSKLNEEKRDLSTGDDSYLANYMDSEPIISGLAGSTHRAKSSPDHADKKQKSSVLSALKCAGGGSKKQNSNLSSSSALPDKITAGGGSTELCHVETKLSNAKKFPLVYQRRKFRSGSEVPCHAFRGNNVSTDVLESDASFSPVVFSSWNPEKQEFSFGDKDLERLGRVEAFCMTDVSGLLKLSPYLVESRQCRLEFSLSVPFISSHPFVANYSWFLHAVFLLHYGTLITIWPMVQLEILFVDNIVGLRVLVFEGCLKHAIAFVLLVLAVFHQSTEQGKFADLQLPVTSIKFKFSGIEDIRKELVFAFYNFSEVKISKWVHLDSTLRRHCLLIQQLPLLECTYDNFKALQNGPSQLLTSCDPISTKATIRKSWHISPMGISVESIRTNTSLSSNSDKSIRWFPRCALSFAAAPSLFFGLHLKLLMEHSATQACHDSLEHQENSGSLLADDCSSLEGYSNSGSESTPDCDFKASSRDTDCNEYLSLAKPDSQPTVVSVSRNCWMKPSPIHQNGDVAVEASAISRASAELGNDAAAASLKKWQFHHSETKEHDVSPKSSVHQDNSSIGSQSLLNLPAVDISPVNELDNYVEKEPHGTPLSVDLSSNMNGVVIPRTNPTAHRSIWHKNTSNSTSFGYLAHGWSEGRGGLLQNNFSNGPKKPRTQVSYALPFGDFGYGSKNKNYFQKGIPSKRIRTANGKKSSGVSKVAGKNLEILSCKANVLITLGERGRRESGVQIVLELFDHEWKLAVKLSGTTRYSYKAQQFLHPGSTNWYTHAMMWKGGKDWILEFPDRSQWALFKEMHEECHNRNIRTALFKNIPIPGVRSIEDDDENGIEVPFVQSSKYFQQLETDVEIALDPSRVLYDMDSHDEEWILKHRTALEVAIGSPQKILEDLFEKAMDLFEKTSYSRQREQFTPEEIEELIAGEGPMTAINIFYEYWLQKRRRSGMPLIRHLLPPQWEKYQQQVREWELTMSKSCTAPPNGYHEKVVPREKPPMFAFCLKPRGLEVPNKGFKQRSQRKISVSVRGNTFSGHHYTFQTYGRRLNVFASGDEKIMYQGHNFEPSDDSPLHQISPRLFSPREAGGEGCYSTSSASDRYDRDYFHKIHRRKTKKPVAYMFHNDAQILAMYNQGMFDKRNRYRYWNSEMSKSLSQRHYYLDRPMCLGHEQFNSSHLDELRMRNATGAAQNALDVAKFRRDKAQRLLYRADLAIHKAVVALLTAEAIKASSGDMNGDR